MDSVVAADTWSACTMYKYVELGWNSIVKNFYIFFIYNLL